MTMTTTTTAHARPGNSKLKISSIAKHTMPVQEATGFVPLKLGKLVGSAFATIGSRRFVVGGGDGGNNNEGANGRGNGGNNNGRGMCSWCQWECTERIFMRHKERTEKRVGFWDGERICR